MHEALLCIKGDGRRYAIVGVPRVITAARHLARVDAVLGQQITVFVALVCGHMKSTHFR
ncbi:Coenzyme F420 hydrogenase/dehydrogenase, beta subunit C-terminal domain [Ancylobacter koreensis]|uniref:Coenzyme F420 hydrogenase/dehydrogenase, beta subunit C-terminal domain n=1 Tax=Ancylobacter koreensis TaxID=266121 RepID=UPI003CCFE9A7